MNRISDFFANRTILITGGTGFVGKVLIEKLLRSCTNLKRIYVMVRPKRGASVDERFRRIFREPLFDVLRTQHGSNIFDKVHIICSDIAAPDLLLSAADRQRIISEVEIIYHSAATVKFNQPLKSTVMLNVRGTHLLLGLAKECRNLMVFTYVSTTFSNEKEDILLEKFYPPPINPHTVIDLCERLDEPVAEKIGTMLRCSYANNYVFSKALGEALVEEQLSHLPVILQRTSIVSPTWQEPIPGWVDNVNHISGMIIAGGKGVLRTLCGKSDAFVDCCPVDVIVKNLILNTYYYHINKNQRVFNLKGPESTQVDLTVNNIIRIGQKICRGEVPFNRVIWYPDVDVKKSFLHHYFELVVGQVFPAVVLDGILICTGRKPTFVKFQKIIHKQNEVFDFLSRKYWKFESSRGVIQGCLSSEEFEIFGTNFEKIDLNDYLKSYILGLRRYVLNEADDDIPKAIRHVKRLGCLDKIIRTGFMLVVGYYAKYVTKQPRFSIDDALKCGSI